MAQDDKDKLRAAIAASGTFQQYMKDVILPGLAALKDVTVELPKELQHPDQGVEYQARKIAARFIEREFVMAFAPKGKEEPKEPDAGEFE